MNQDRFSRPDSIGAQNDNTVETIRQAQGERILRSAQNDKKGITWPGHSVLPPEAAFSSDPAIRELYWASVPGGR